MPETYKAPEIHTEGENAQGNAASFARAEILGREPHIDGLDLLLVLSHRKKTILGVTLAASVVAAIVSLLLPSSYTATTTILPPQQTQSASIALLGQVGVLSGLSGADLGLKNPADIFIAILQSRTVQDALVNQFDLRRVYGVKRYQDARKKLNKHSEILTDKEGLISISVTDSYPKRAAEMANAYVDQMRSLNQNLAVSEAAQRRLFYQQKLDAEWEDLSRAELAMKEAQEKSGLIQPEAQGKAIIDTVATTRAQVGIKEVQLQAMRTYATANNPELKRAEQELAGLRGELARLERSTGALGHGNLEIPTQRLPEVQLDYIRRARDMRYHEALYELLGKQLEAARIDEAKEAIIVQVVDKAVVPERRSGPRRTIIVGLTTFIALMLSCVRVLVADAIERKRQDLADGARLALLRDSFRWTS